MESVVRPSRQILRKACDMGRKLARREHRIDIDLSLCHRSVSYEMFRMTNRARLQSLPAMAVLEEQLRSLVRQCTMGMDARASTHAREAVEEQVTRPIYDAFWAGWEEQVDLPRRYQEAVDAQEAKGSAPTLNVHEDDVLRLAGPDNTMTAPDPAVVGAAEANAGDRSSGTMQLRPAATRDLEGESGPRHQGTRTIFDEAVIADDDVFWALTGAQQESDHTGDESLDNLPKVFGTIRPVSEQGEVQPVNLHLEEAPQSGALTGSLVMWA